MHQSGEERDDDELLARFADEQNEHVLFIGRYDYAQATQSLPIEAHVHQAWYMVLLCHFTPRSVPQAHRRNWKELIGGTH